MNRTSQNSPTPLTSPHRVVRSAQCLFTEVDTETVLMSIESGCYGGLDDIGGDIWRRLQHPVAIADLCDALAAEYDASRAVIETDVLAFLGALLQRQMIEVVSD